MIIVITGPTCTNKSQTAFELAKILDAEIINGDAFQIYKELNIGVAKPPLCYLEHIKHHLYDCIEVDKPFSIAQYQTLLRKTIEEIDAKHKSIIIVGGSMLYIRSALYDYSFDNAQSIDMKEYEKMSNESLHAYLASIDHNESTKIHVNNRKRLLRAIEIYLSTGKTKSDIIASQNHKPLYDCLFFVKDIARDELYKRIDARVDKMIKDGLVEEVKLINEKYDSSLQSLQAIGYKEMFSYLKGDISLEDTISLIKKNTRNYAKRQMTFLRHQFDVHYYNNIEDILKVIKHE